MRIIEDPNLTMPGPPLIIIRSWRERLFTWPWRPLQRRRMDETRIPSTGIFKIGPDTFVAHPVTARRIRQELRSDDSIRAQARPLR